MTQWKKLLHSLDFTDSESTIYLASLEMGPSSVQDIARKARVSRVTTYAVIEALAERGLMSSLEKGKKKMFVAESPERLVSFVHGRVKQMEATLKEIESSLHDLKMIQKGEKPVVKLFEGPEALKAIQDDVLRSRPAHLDEFGNLDELRDVYQSAEVFQSFYREMHKFKPKVRAILFAKKNQVKAGSPNDQIVHIAQQDQEFKGDILLYKNKVALSTFVGKHVSVLIESEDIAKTFRAWFDYAWKNGQKK